MMLELVIAENFIYLVASLRCWRIYLFERASMVGWTADNGWGRGVQLCSICICTSNPGDTIGCAEHCC